MTLLRFTWGATVLSLLFGTALICIAFVSASDPDTWPSANAPGEVKEHGVLYFVYGATAVLMGLILGFVAFVASFVGKRQQMSRNKEVT